ncbi:DNA-methyltransferase [Virgibacillus sp. DJP39]|uniref:DNA-methyltransferase n=1 Tax=Virgibacillus sp. DJP39 TaxID=3409790 RepID=UPI003BB796D7
MEEENGEFELEKVHYGDSMELSKKLEDEIFKLTLFSPPYASQIDYDGKGLGKIKPDQYVDWIRPLIKELHRVLVNDGVFVLNMSNVVIDGFIHPYKRKTINLIIDEFGFKELDLNHWIKPSTQDMREPTRNITEDIHVFTKTEKYTYNFENVSIEYSEETLKRYKSPFYKKDKKTGERKKIWRLPKEIGALPTNTVYFPSDKKKSKQHPAPFPISLPIRYILAFSNENDIVFDPFSGSGTTFEASKGLKRRFLGFEANEKFIGISNSNVEKMPEGKLLEEHKKERENMKKKIKRQIQEILEIQISKGRNDDIAREYSNRKAEGLVEEKEVS